MTLLQTVKKIYSPKYNDPDNIKSETTDDDNKKAQIFADYFSSVFTKEPEGNIPMLQNKIITKEMMDLEVRNEDIIKQIKKLKPNKSPGPDGIHHKFIKNIGESISEPLCLIFNKSLEQKKIPDPWKQAKICAIFKKGNKKVASN